MARILVIDDTDLNVKLATAILEAAGHDVLSASDAANGVEVARARSPNVVLMDVLLPGVDGVEAMRTLKSDPTTAAIPVLAVTAFAMRGDMERFLSSGFDGYLSKPYKAADLLTAIETFLRIG